SQHAEVLAVLLVDSLDVFGDHQLDSGAQLGVGRLLAAGTFAATLAADGSNEAAFFHVASLDWKFIAAFQSGVGKLAEGLVEEKTDVGGSDFVGGDIVAQFGIVLWILCVPRKVFAGELALDELGVFGEEQNTALELNRIRPLFYVPVEQSVHKTNSHSRSRSYFTPLKIVFANARANPLAFGPTAR